MTQNKDKVKHQKAHRIRENNMKMSMPKEDRVPPKITRKTSKRKRIIIITLQKCVNIARLE